ncbi:unnamed protein product [Effrenium voratum]|nr:unnamed protein product [Effrenium voratum]
MAIAALVALVLTLTAAYREPELARRIDLAHERSVCHGEPLPTTGSESCFCFMAGACAECNCPQGCDSEVAQRHRRTATFKNLHAAVNCVNQSSVAFLSIPRKNFRNVSSLVASCGAIAEEVIQEALLEGFLAFRRVSDGAVRQCIHAPGFQSVKWMHIHTFCQDGWVDGPVDRPLMGVFWCGRMEAESQAPQLARQLLQWEAKLRAV